jgi:hypothetical protein
MLVGTSPQYTFTSFPYFHQFFLFAHLQLNSQKNVLWLKKILEGHLAPPPANVILLYSSNSLHMCSCALKSETWHATAQRCGRNRDCVVGVVTGPRSGRIVVRISAGARDFFPDADRLWGPPNLLLNGYWYTFPWVKRLGREVHGLSPPSDEVKNSWSYIHLLPLYT